MRKLLTNFIGASVAQPIKKGTLDHLQLSYQEAINALAQSQIGNDYDPAKVYILYGCVNSDTAPNYDISAGAVFYDGEVYLVDAVVFVAADTAVGTITQSYFADATADPVTFTDGVAHNVHEIKKMVIADGVSGSGEADFADWLNGIGNWVIDLSPTVVYFGGTGTANILSKSIKYFANSEYVILNYVISMQCTGSGTVGIDITLPFLADNGLQEASSAIAINPAGDYKMFRSYIDATGSKLSLFGYGLVNTSVYPTFGQITYQRRK